MRVELDRRRHGTDRSRPFDNRSQYLLMFELQAVRNAERQNRRLLNGRILSAAKYFHFTSRFYLLNG